MAGDNGWIPEDIDTKRPRIARMYDYALGGGHNLASDRVVFEQLLRILPNAREVAWINRAFMRRVVLFMIDEGIRQFLDLGSGIPTVGNVHEIAHKADPSVRVVYVDCEDVAVAHSRLLLQGNERATIIEADIKSPKDILQHPDTVRLLDFDQPMGLLAIAVGHYVQPPDDVEEVFESYRDAIAPGSMLGISHITGDFERMRAREVVEMIQCACNERIYLRCKAKIHRLFGDFELVEPGLVPPGSWRPDNPPSPGMQAGDEGLWGGVGVKQQRSTPERTESRPRGADFKADVIPLD
jgi:hypothetical protein